MIRINFQRTQLMKIQHIPVTITLDGGGGAYPKILLHTLNKHANAVRTLLDIFIKSKSQVFGSVLLLIQYNVTPHVSTVTETESIALQCFEC